MTATLEQNHRTAIREFRTTLDNVCETLKQKSSLEWHVVFDDDTILLESAPRNFEDWIGVFHIELNNMWELTGDKEFEEKPYHPNLSVVDIKPFKDKRESAKDFLEKSDMSYYTEDNAMEMLPEALHSYGRSAMLKQSMESYATLGEAMDFIYENLEFDLHLLLGFSLDKAQNQVGSTGWDFMAGNLTVRNRGQKIEAI